MCRFGVCNRLVFTMDLVCQVMVEGAWMMNMNKCRIVVICSKNLFCLDLVCMICGKSVACYRINVCGEINACGLVEKIQMMER